MNDRTVHAVLSDGAELVRYDRAGKWYFEGRIRRHLPLPEILQFIDADTTLLLGRSGGGQFDKRAAAVRDKRVRAMGGVADA